MKCKSKTLVECGNWQNGYCMTDVKCQFQVEGTETNYDRIRKMSVEEMAKVIVEAPSCLSCEYLNKETGLCGHSESSEQSLYEGCTEATKKWLESEVSDSENCV